MPNPPDRDARGRGMAPTDILKTRATRLRRSMCDAKASFRSRETAMRTAEKHGQRVYECPICFCWHCTSKENWADDYVTRAHMDQRLLQLEHELRTEANKKLRERGRRIAELEAELKALKGYYAVHPTPAEAAR